MSDFKAEIVNDELSALLTKLASEPGVTTVLEVGSGDGKGSTQALIKGLGYKPGVRLGCLETRLVRFTQLVAVVERFCDCKTYLLRASSVPFARWMNAEDIRTFHREKLTKLNEYPVNEVLLWLEGEKEAAKDLPREGISQVKTHFGVDRFDLVLLDGCPFCGMSDLQAVLGSKIIVLDDVNDIKNHDACRFLAAHKDYTMLEINLELRNGFAVFERAA